MDRTIKFRAWDGVGMTISPSISECHHLASWFEAHSKYLNDKQAVFMQYTGLNDKNGVEIYEGDVVKMNRNPNSKRGQSFEHTGVAFITPEVGVVFEGNSNKNGDWMPYDVPEYEYEIIGNIYANPELLR